MQIGRLSCLHLCRTCPGCPFCQEEQDGDTSQIEKQHSLLKALQKDNQPNPEEEDEKEMWKFFFVSTLKDEMAKKARAIQYQLKHVLSLLSPTPRASESR